MTKRSESRSVTILSATSALLWLSGPGCVSGPSEDLTAPIRDEPITAAELAEGVDAVEAARAGGLDASIDGMPPTYDTDGDPELTPEPLPPTAEELAADRVTLAGAVDDEVTPVLEEPLLISPEAGLDPAASSGSCRSATGYISGRPFQLCVTTIDGHLVGVRTAHAFERMDAAARRDGVNLSIVSGFRTMHQQRHLYHLWLEGRGNLAARPGYSNHQSGIALDLNTSTHGVYRWLSHHGHHFGFRRTVPSEIWHWEYRP